VSGFEWPATFPLRVRVASRFQRWGDDNLTRSERKYLVRRFRRVHSPLATTYYALYPVRLWLLVAKAAAYRLVGKELR